MALMGIDVGTTGVKCTIADTRGRVLSQSYREYETVSPQYGYYELDPDLVWEETKTVIREAAEKVREPILGISVSSFGESFAAVDGEGNTLYPSMVYTDVRGVEETEELCRNIPAETITEKTSLKPSFTYSLPKLMWLRKHQPEIFGKIKKIYLYGSFILYKLGGVDAIDYSLAARSMALNINTNTWDEDILQAAGIPLVIFPALYPMGTFVGTVFPDLAGELGLSPDSKLVVGAHDQICAAIGSGTHEVGTAMDGMGSVDCIAPVFTKEVDVALNAQNNYPLLPYLGDTYTTYAYIYDGGTLLRWYRDNFCSYEREEAEQMGKSVYALLDERAAKEPTDLLFLPHVSGSAMPYMDVFSKGILVGVDRSTDKARLYRALLEGVAYELRVNLELLEQAGIHIHTLIACGGGANSDIWLQIKADVFNKKIVAVKNKEAGTLGVIMIAGVAAGVFSDFKQAMKEIALPGKTFLPNPEYAAKYEKNYQKYKKIYRLSKEILEDA